MTILITLLILLLVFVGFDLALALQEILARIHIGRWNDRIAWQQAVERKARQWLKRSPTVSIDDNKRWILYDIIRGKYRSKTIQSWQDAGLLLALDKEASLQYASRTIDMQTGNWKKAPTQLDEILPAYVLKKNRTLPLQAEQACLNFLKQLKGSQTSIPYRSFIPDVRFVDTIGMVVPFLMLCGETNLAMIQIEEYDQAKLPHSNIPPHAYDIVQKRPLGIYDWGRGIGWYILGLVEGNTAGQFNDRIVFLAKEMLSFQKKEGGFSSMFFNKAASCESSGTALIGLLFSEAYKISSQSIFLEAAFRVERQLMSLTRRTGAIDFCQGDTKGIGYYSTSSSVMPFAQGIALMLSKRLNEYAHQ